MPSDREVIGNLYVENQRILEEYRKLLGLVEQIGLGNIKPDQLVVDADSQSWSVVQFPEDSPETAQQDEQSA